MRKPVEEKNVKPWTPQGDGFHVHIDLKDFTDKALKHGPGHVLAETIFNLALLANDHLKSLKVGTKKNERSSSKNSALPS